MSVAGYEKGIKDIHTLQMALGISDYNEFYYAMKDLEDQGKIKATKNGRDTNGKYPPLAKKYRIIEDQEEIVDYSDEIKHRFPLKFDKTYYKRHSSAYVKDRGLILVLIDYERDLKRPLATEMSVNERLFDIFTHEKEVAFGRVVKILENLGLNEKWLNCYKTPEPFIYFSRSVAEDQKILIVENKDSWHTMCRLMKLGIGEFDSVIYGEGKKILSSYEELGVHQKAWFNKKTNLFYYLGDLDDEGLNIYQGLAKRAESKGYTIKLWEVAYEQMYVLGEEKNRWRVFKAQKSIEGQRLGELLGFMATPMVDCIWAHFNQNAYIPQEILNYSVLKKLLSEASLCINS